MDEQLENWATGDDYEQFMGRWSSEVAIQFIKWLKIPAAQTWLDLGCGTGALTRTVNQYAQPHQTFGIDRSFDFVRYANQQTNNCQFVTSDGSFLPFAEGTFDVLVSGLALNFIPDPTRALAEMKRVVKSGGVVAAYVWDYAEKMEFLRYFWDAVVDLDETALIMHEGKRFPICEPNALSRLWQSTDLKNITVDPIDVPTVFDNFKSYWQPFTLGNFPAPQYVSKLNEERQATLREHLKSVIPIENDGSINLIARVWAVRGYR